MIVEALDSYFESKTNAEQREVAGGQLWRASLLGNCLRRQVLQQAMGAPLPPVDARTARIFEVGHLTGRLVEDAFNEMGVLEAAEFAMSDSDSRLGGHLDFLVNFDPMKFNPTGEPRRFGIELKSKQSKSFWWAAKRGEPVAGDEQRIQAASYAFLARNYPELEGVEFIVLSVSKDDLTMKVTTLTQQDHAAVPQRLRALNVAAQRRDPYLVECVCMTAWSGKMKNYCPFYDESLDVCCEPDLIFKEVDPTWV